MQTKYDLKQIVEAIEKKSKSKAQLDSKFQLEYLIPDVEEKDLTDIGFEYKGKSSYHIYPMYELGNILAVFEAGILHVTEII